MHHLLIIDDQSLLADDLADMLPWGEIGIGTVHKAYSAQEALQLMREQAIDVLVTDIRMPGMSGIELIRRIKEEGKHTKCILLSGYSDFEYAKQALQLKSSDYLLKPVADEEILAAVRKALEELNREWEEIGSMRRALYRLREQLPMLREYLLLDLLTGKDASFNGSFLRKLERYEVPFRPNDSFRLMLLRRESGDAAWPDDSEELLDYALVNMAQEIFADRFHLWHAKDVHGFIVCLLQVTGANPDPQTAPGSEAEPALRSPDSDSGGRRPGSPDEWLEQRAQKLQHMTKLYLKTELSALLSRPGTFPSDVRSVYEEATVGFRRYIGRDGDLLVSLPHEPEAAPPRLLDELYRPPALQTLLEVGQWEEAEAKLERVFADLQRSGADLPEQVVETYFAIAAALAAISHKNKKPLRDTAGRPIFLAAGTRMPQTAEQLRQWASEVMAGLIREARMEEKDSRSALIRQTQDFIRNNLGSATLSTIAASVHLNPSYLSKIYKLETGEGISEYLLRARMEQAAVLLRETGEKIYDISEKLGYQKPSYFIQLFKKTFGMTPQEYRNRTQ